jgi:succinate-semialdehyde dehydrogenase/glutarate-semialdehyde dehydrogenase
VDELVEHFLLAAEQAPRVHGQILPSTDVNKRVLIQRVPRGVVGIITPWNWPYTMPAEIIAPALAFGNTVVWVPAPSTSVCAVRLAECIVEADLPEGVFNLIPGAGPVVGEELAANPGVAVIGFIGSIETGKQVAQRAAGKELLLELGGNGPMLILEVADLDAAVEATLSGCFLCAGQSCSASELILIHERIQEDYTQRLLDAIQRSIRLGDPFNTSTTLGPLNNEPTADKMDLHVADAVKNGANVVLGGQRASGFPTNLYYPPTIIDRVNDNMLVFSQETFGPIVPIRKIRDEDEAIQIANSQIYGLACAVFTADLRRGLAFAEQVRSGTVFINESTNAYEIHLPFGGSAGSSSGIGRVGGDYTVEKLTDLKTVVYRM